MANVIKDVNYFDSFFADLVQNILGTTQDKVRISYAEEGQVSFKINDNICFVHTMLEDNFVNKFKNQSLEYIGTEDVFVHSLSVMRVLYLKIVFYGNQSSVNSVLVSESLHLDSILQKLHNEDLAIIGDRTKLVKTRELINSRWWERTDLDLYFYNSIVVEEKPEPIDEVDITITDSDIKVIID